MQGQAGCKEAGCRGKQGRGKPCPYILGRGGGGACRYLSNTLYLQKHLIRFFGKLLGGAFLLSMRLRKRSNVRESVDRHCA